MGRRLPVPASGRGVERRGYRQWGSAEEKDGMGLTSLFESELERTPSSETVTRWPFVSSAQAKLCKGMSLLFLTQNNFHVPSLNLAMLVLAVPFLFF